MKDQCEINFFNNMRPHQKLGMFTPKDTEEKFLTGKQKRTVWNSNQNHPKCPCGIIWWA